MVLNHVEIETLSYKEGSEPVFWSCDGSIEYEIGKGTKTTRGTLVRLNLTEDAKEYLDGIKAQRDFKKILQVFKRPDLLEWRTNQYT